MNKLFVVLCLSLFFCGCGQDNGKLEFIQVVQSHRELTVQTNTAVIASIRDEMIELESNGLLSKEDRDSMDFLMENLQFQMIQSIIIEEYVNSNEMNRELLSKLLRSKWNESIQKNNE